MALSVRLLQSSKDTVTARTNVVEMTPEGVNIEIEGETLADDLRKFGTWTIREQTP